MTNPMNTVGNVANYLEEDGFVGGLLNQYAEDAANSLGRDLTAPWSEGLVRKIVEIISGNDPDVKPSPLLRKTIGVVGSGMARGLSGWVNWETLVPRSKFAPGKDGDKAHRNSARLVREMFQEAGRGAGDAFKDAASRDSSLPQVRVPAGGVSGGRLLAWNPLFGKIAHTVDSESGTIMCVDAIMAQTMQNMRVSSMRDRVHLNQKGKNPPVLTDLATTDPGWQLISEADAALQGIALCPHCAALHRDGTSKPKTTTSQLSEDEGLALSAVVTECLHSARRNDAEVIEGALPLIADSPKDIAHLATALRAVVTKNKQVRKDGEVIHYVGVENIDIVPQIVSLCQLFGGEGDNALKIRDAVDKIVDGNEVAEYATAAVGWVKDRAPAYARYAMHIVVALVVVFTVAFTFWVYGWFYGKPVVFSVAAFALAAELIIVGFLSQWLWDLLAKLWENGTVLARVLIAQLENLANGLPSGPPKQGQPLRKVAFAAFVGVMVYTVLVHIVMREEIWFGLSGVCVEARWAAAISLASALVYTVAPDSWRGFMTPPDWARRFSMSTTISTSMWYRRLGKITALATLFVVPLVWVTGELGVGQRVSPGWTLSGVEEGGSTYLYLPDGKKVSASDTPLAIAFESGQAKIDDSKTGNGTVKVRPGTVIKGNPNDGYTYEVQKRGRVKVYAAELDSVRNLGAATITDQEASVSTAANNSIARSSNDGFLAEIERRTDLPAWLTIIFVVFVGLAGWGFLTFLFGRKDGPRPARGFTLFAVSGALALVLAAIIGIGTVGTAIWGKPTPTATYVAAPSAASTVGAESTGTTEPSRSYLEADQASDAAIAKLEELARR